MDIVFRADASLDIGTGHVMRCLTLADALRRRGANCRFICREHPGHLVDFIHQQGYESHILPCLESGEFMDRHDKQGPQVGHSEWLGASWYDDAQQTLSGLDGGPVDWLVVDHYALDSDWEALMRPVCRRLMVIDDLADRAHECDLLLDQNLGRVRNDYTHLVSPKCITLTGPTYALLRPEFAELRPYSLSRRSRPEFRRLLITMGGVDKDNATCSVLEALRECLLPTGCRISVVMGSNAPWLAQVHNLAEQMPWPTEVLVNVSDMARVMAESDMAIGAAGSTSWERCSFGLPSIVVVLAENQRSIASALQISGAAISMKLESMAAELHKFFNKGGGDASWLKSTSAIAANLTDGEGASFVCNMMYTEETR